MLFNSVLFIVFFAAVYPLYLLLRHRPQNYLLLVASYVFYGAWDWRFLGLLLFSTVVDYFAALYMARSASVPGRRLALLSSVGTQLLILFTFKYFGFFAESAAGLLRAAGFAPDFVTLNIVLPVGISFYTFQTMSYTIDVYRGHLEASPDFIDFALFVSFFPQLVAGPIERATNLLPQVRKPRTVTHEALREALWLILLGYFKKVVVADNLAPLAETLFVNPLGASRGFTLVGIYSFAFQIYGDFSGYSDIARGLAKLMGFDLMVNFRRPYLALDPRDFWNRWHISLSTWLRDYLYVPLGGNRNGTRQTYRNLVITMLLGGLWHGAAWHYVAWGAYQGALLVVHRACRGLLARLLPESVSGGQAWKALQVILYFQLTCFGWVLFAVRKLADVPVILGNLLHAPWMPVNRAGLATLVLFGGPLLLLDILQERYGEELPVLYRLAPATRLAVYALMMVVILSAGVIDGREFIYFQF